MKLLQNLQHKRRKALVIAKYTSRLYMQPSVLEGGQHICKAKDACRTTAPMQVDSKAGMLEQAQSGSQAHAECT
jgi:hypothetical protein